jgi:cyclomaltodextrin glucanotransferase
MIDFRDQTIYYIAIEHFHRKANDSANAKLDNSDLAKSGQTDTLCGNIEGIIDKLDYLKELGISTLWLSPVFELAENTEDYENRSSNKYFGYWAEDFRKLNRNLINDEKDVFPFKNNKSVIDKLIIEAEKRGLSVIIDFACNYSSKNPNTPKMKIALEEKVISFENKEDKSWYHNYINEKDEWKNKWQEDNQKRCGYPHFNEFSYDFRNYMWQTLKDWLKKGIKGFSIDTFKNMPEWFWHEFYSEIKNYDESLFVFGQWAWGGCNNEESVRFSNNTSIAIQDFSLRKAIEDIFIRNNPAGFYLIDEVFLKDGKFNNINELITFIDCGNFPRFLSGNNNYKKFELALNLILTCRGVPLIYYGNEQYLVEESESHDCISMKDWDTSKKIFKNIQILTKLRKDNIAVQRGFQQTRYITDNIFVFHREYGYNFCVVAMNKGPEKLFDVAGVDIPDGTYEDLLSGKKITVENHRIIQLLLKENDTVVISKHDEIVKEETKITFQLNGYDTHFGEVVKVVGNCPELGGWDVSKAPSLQYINSGTWMGDVFITESFGKPVYYKYVVIDFNKSIKYELRSNRSRFLPPKGHHVTWKNIWV